mmetsp:Transcript_10263/g.32447  ORF Transcript_10263/g.32447 Transcript_10263/m.32447 type:complete len:260 (-) Transcript_10263:1048-1827(-)
MASRTRSSTGPFPLTMTSTTPSTNLFARSHARLFAACRAAWVLCRVASVRRPYHVGTTRHAAHTIARLAADPGAASAATSPPLPLPPQAPCPPSGAVCGASAPSWSPSPAAPRPTRNGRSASARAIASTSAAAGSATPCRPRFSDTRSAMRLATVATSLLRSSSAACRCSRRPLIASRNTAGSLPTWVTCPPAAPVPRQTSPTARIAAPFSLPFASCSSSAAPASWTCEWSNMRSYAARLASFAIRMQNAPSCVSGAAL